MARAYYRPSIEANQEVNFFKYVIMLGIILVNYNCSLKCIEKVLVKYSYFGCCLKSGDLYDHSMIKKNMAMIRVSWKFQKWWNRWPWTQFEVANHPELIACPCSTKKRIHVHLDDIKWPNSASLKPIPVSNQLYQVTFELHIILFQSFFCWMKETECS